MKLIFNQYAPIKELVKYPPLLYLFGFEPKFVSDNWLLPGSIPLWGGIDFKAKPINRNSGPRLLVCLGFFFPGELLSIWKGRGYSSEILKRTPRVQRSCYAGVA